jgi:hypothetical protein
MNVCAHVKTQRLTRVNYREADKDMQVSTYLTLSGRKEAKKHKAGQERNEADKVRA